MSISSKGAYVPGAQGYTLAEAIAGETPTGVSDGDRREPPAVKCRFKGCTTILSVPNRRGRKHEPKLEVEEPCETEPNLDESGIRPSTPPPEPPKPKSESKKTKGHDPVSKISKRGLCHLHQQMVLFYEMGYRDVPTPRFDDDPVPPPPPKPDPSSGI